MAFSWEKCRPCAPVTQGRTLDELLQNIREVISLCVEDKADVADWAEFVAVQVVTL